MLLIALWILLMSHLSYDKDFSGTEKTAAMTILGVLAVVYVIFVLF